jgi:hypothetical protein
MLLIILAETWGTIIPGFSTWQVPRNRISSSIFWFQQNCLDFESLLRADFNDPFDASAVHRANILIFRIARLSARCIHIQISILHINSAFLLDLSREASVGASLLHRGWFFDQLCWFCLGFLVDALSHSDSRAPLCSSPDWVSFIPDGFPVLWSAEEANSLQSYRTNE